MSDARQEAQFRQHMSEMRRAAHGLGRDFAAEFADLDRKIERFGSDTSKGAANLGSDIEEGLTNLGRMIDDQVSRIPGRIASGASRAGGATRDAFVAAGKRTREGTKNALASAAGVRRRPMRSWSAPGSESSDSDE
jgi:hypothetical protein